MKKLFIWMIITALLFVPMTALAEGESEEPQDPQPTGTPGTEPLGDEPGGEEEPPVPPVNLEIDNGHVYEGMTRAYENGYTPTVNDGKAIVVLPLIASGEIAGNMVTATPNLGGSSSPFKYSNYQKNFYLADNAVQGDTTVSSYLVRFDLPLERDRFDGVYPVSIDINATAADGNAIQQSFTTYVVITDGKDPNAPEPTPKPEEPQSQPKIIVSRYSINPSPVMAGDEFDATITLKNTSETKSVRNMTATISCDSQNFVLKNDISIIYIGKLDKGQQKEIKVTYKTDMETPPQRYTIMLNIEYDNSDAVTFSSSGTVPVAVKQPLRMEMEAPQIPESVNAGDTMPISVQVMNMGRSQVFNVRLELSAPGLIPSETAFIGNMEPGSATAGEMNVFVGMKSMSEGYEGDEKYGYTNGLITLIYEDESGQEYTEEIEIATLINEPVIIPTSTEPEEEPEKAGQWWISIIIGAVVIAGLATYLIVRKKKGQKHEVH